MTLFSMNAIAKTAAAYVAAFVAGDDAAARRHLIEWYADRSAMLRAGGHLHFPLTADELWLNQQMHDLCCNDADSVQAA